MYMKQVLTMVLITSAYFQNVNYISKLEKSSLSYTNQGKTMILPQANNGMQLVCSIVCKFRWHCYV